MPEELAEALDWAEYHKSRAEEEAAERRALEEENASLATRLLASEAKLIRLYERMLGLD